MKLNLSRKNYSLKTLDFIHNQFMIGNGRIGYKGTLEEDDSVVFNLCGIYDQYLDKWRESLNLFNPLSFKIYIDDELKHYSNSLSHSINLKINEAIFKRTTIFKDIELISKRFISRVHDHLIVDKIIIKALDDVSLKVISGINNNIYEINGPHYLKTIRKENKDLIYLQGITNENHHLFVYLKEDSEVERKIIYVPNGIFYEYQFFLKKGMSVEFIKKGFVSIDSDIVNDSSFKKIINTSFYELYKEHVTAFKNDFNFYKVNLTSNDDSEFLLNYSIYQLLILKNSHFDTSIPARGLSGQVYKGAIFWDSEIFMFPFFLCHDLEMAKSLLRYRIKTLNGAKNKSQRFSYQGAFFAWESQEDGVERCSLYNVSDAKTNKPIRTYFADKQIHISADVVYAFNAYYFYTKDFSFYLNALELIFEVYKFYKSYATLLNNQYHFLDVVGPDEYHERVNDNAFTNYHIYFTLLDFIHILDKENYDYPHKEEMLDFINHIYLPKINENGVIEQFDGYFLLKDIKYNDYLDVIKKEKNYLGGENGLLTPTRIIKQADVITLLALYKNRFSYEVKKANFDFYYPYTEHGSSLSNSMYSLLASDIGELDLAYLSFRKSAGVEFNKNNKMYAGGIYIGGTHPASNAGAFLAIFYGMLGFYIDEDGYHFKPSLPPQIKHISLKFKFNNQIISEDFKND